MTEKRILRLALVSLLAFCLITPSAFAVSGAKTHGSISSVTTNEGDFTYPSGAPGTYWVRWVAQWKANEGVDGKPDSGFFTVKKYDYADYDEQTGGLVYFDNVTYQETYPVTNVTRIDDRTIEFETPGWVYSPSESQWYSIGLYRTVDNGDHADLHWWCCVCEDWHSMVAGYTRVHLNAPKVRIPK